MFYLGVPKKALSSSSSKKKKVVPKKSTKKKNKRKTTEKSEKGMHLMHKYIVLYEYFINIMMRRI